MGDGIGLPEKPNGDWVSTAAVCSVGIAAAVLNFVFVFELAVSAGYASAIAWLYWIVLDGTGLASMRVVLRGASSPAVRRLAAFTALLALAVSIGACGLHAFLEDGELPRWAKFVVSALPALMLGLTCKLLLAMRSKLGTVATATPEIAIGDAEPLDELEATKAPRGPEEGAGGAEATKSAKARRTPAAEGKTERFKTALAALGPADGRTTNQLVEDLNEGIDLHPGTARRLVGAYRATLRERPRLEVAS